MPRGKPEVVADHRRRAGLATHGLGLDDDGGQTLGRAVHGRREARRTRAHDAEIHDRAEVDGVGTPVDRGGHLAHRRRRHHLGVRRVDERPALAHRRSGDDLATHLGVRRVDPVRHAHPVEEVADRQRQRVLARRHELHRRDLGLRDRRAPVGQQLADGGVELLVPLAARHQQVRVVLALPQAGPQPLGVLEEPLPRRDHEPLRRRHDLSPGVEGREHVGLVVRRRRRGRARSPRRTSPRARPSPRSRSRCRWRCAPRSPVGCRSRASTARTRRPGRPRCRGRR